MAHSPFQYQSLEQLQSDLCEKNITFTPATDFSILNSKVNSKLSNRLALQAMEGCDGNPDGSPSPLTIRRYLRFAESGAAFQYIEATAVIPTGRANPRQLMITKDNVNTFANLVSQIRQKAKEEESLSEDGIITTDIEKEGYLLALNPDLEEFINLDSFKHHFGDIIEYRTMSYYKDRFGREHNIN